MITFRSLNLDRRLRLVDTIVGHHNPFPSVAPLKVGQSQDVLQCKWLMKADIERVMYHLVVGPSAVCRALRPWHHRSAVSLPQKGDLCRVSLGLDGHLYTIALLSTHGPGDAYELGAVLHIEIN